MPHSKGHLNPGASGVVFHRFELDPALADLVRHVWIVRWSVAAGETSAQRVLGYPAFNLIVDEAGATLAGADPRLFVKPLTGASWTVGVLLRPAAGSLLTSTEPAQLVGRIETLIGAPAAAISKAMAGGSGDDDPDSEQNADVAVLELLTRWLHPLAERMDARGRLLNEACRLAEEDTTVLRTAQLAERLGVSIRTLERLVREQLGVTPKWLIECRRLQAAATTLFAHPETDLSELALELGYADYAHFSRRYKSVLGQTPGADRARG